MAEFKDGNGESRTLELNVFTVERIRSNVQFPDNEPVNLYKIADEDLERMNREAGEVYAHNPTTLEKLTSDPITLAKVIHAAMDCEFEEFARSMNGEGIANATDALIREIIQLFPPSRQKAMMEAYLKGKELEQRISERALQQVQSQAFQNHLDREFQAFDEQCGKLLDASESTPDRSP